VHDEQPFTILCVGRLTPAKGQRILIDACQQLAAAGRDFRLVVIGAGPDTADLKAAVSAHGLEPQVTFTGALNQEQVAAWYARADTFALPSFAEGIPVVLMEAMASGVPCVTTRITGIPELIRDGEDGLLVSPSDSEELAAVLARLMDDPGLRARLAAAGRERVCARYDLARNVERLGSIFEARLETVKC
jgi:glycosyltransferase involved in cell wall biosynthesis